MRYCLPLLSTAPYSPHAPVSPLSLSLPPSPLSIALSYTVHTYVRWIVAGGRGSLLDRIKTLGQFPNTNQEVWCVWFARVIFGWNMRVFRFCII
jgi:hypothetical protein